MFPPGECFTLESLYGGSLQAMGEGDVLLTTRTAQGVRMQLRLNNVLYVPSLAVNVLSLYRCRGRFSMMPSHATFAHGDVEWSLSTTWGLPALMHEPPQSQ